MIAEEESVEQAAISRRERLKALKAANELLSRPDDDSAREETKVEGAEGEEEEEVSVKFRNYLPHDKQLQENKLAPPVLPKFEDPVTAAPVTQDTATDPFINIAPKKPNWDLRRDIQKKLDKLEKRTQKALYEIMLEQEQQELASAGENGEAS